MSSLLHDVLALRAFTADSRADTEAGPGAALPSGGLNGAMLSSTTVEKKRGRLLDMHSLLALCKAAREEPCVGGILSVPFSNLPRHLSWPVYGVSGGGGGGGGETSGC